MKIKEYSSDSLYANKFTSSKTNKQLPRMGMHIFPCKKGLYTRTVIQKKIFSTINKINRGIYMQPFKKKKVLSLPLLKHSLTSSTVVKLYNKPIMANLPCENYIVMRVFPIQHT